MIETRLIRPASRLVDALCPVCHHARRIYSNEHQGIAHCIYCGSDFEWVDNERGHSARQVTEVANWFSGLVNTPVS